MYACHTVAQVSLVIMDSSFLSLLPLALPLTMRFFAIEFSGAIPVNNQLLNLFSLKIA